MDNSPKFPYLSFSNIFVAYGNKCYKKKIVGLESLQFQIQNNQTQFLTHGMFELMLGLSGCKVIAYLVSGEVT